MEGILRQIPNFQMRRSLDSQGVLQTIPLPGKQLRKSGNVNGLKVVYNNNNNIFCLVLIITTDMVVVVDECLNDTDVVAY